LDSGKMGIEERSVDLSEIVQDVVDSQHSLADAARNEIEVALLPPDKSLVQGDPIRLRQIIMNLVGNAVKFTQNGMIHISVDRLGYENMVEISVADTGIGIDQADKDRVFSDFVTLDTTYDRKNTGTGLGLGIASRMTKAMGGEIGVESEPGEGSLFWVRLPLPPAPVGALPDLEAPEPMSLLPEPERPAAPGNAPLDILVVEDNEINRLVVREMLEKAGHHVTEAMDGQEGTDAARIKRYDLILMDISMPRMDGVEATRLIRGEGGASADTPIVALTAHALLEEVSRFKAVGMDHTLTKPISRKTLQIALDLAQGQGGADNNSDSPGAGHRASPKVRVTGDPVDVERLNTMSGEVGADRMALLLDAFVKEADVSVAKISALRPGADKAEVIAQLHQLAGSAAIFGAKSLHGWLQTMEARGKSGDMDSVFANLHQISEIWITTRARIGELKDITTHA
jgi:CheY-like chemotaxis protein/HPt (histidine-containing phosphotransfer) domain-containing protein/anti-sigma regulatory factor (Ser/Thr protein kinase)